MDTWILGFHTLLLDEGNSFLGGMSTGKNDSIIAQRESEKVGIKNVICWDIILLQIFNKDPALLSTLANQHNLVSLDMLQHI